MKEKITRFNLEDAFKALDEIEIPKVKGLRPRQLDEDFSMKRVDRFEALFEDYYDVQDQNDMLDAKQDRSDEIAKAKLARIEKIVDLDADSPEDIQPSYVGKYIMQCPQCMTLFYKDEADIARSEDDESIVNIGEVCQHCGNEDGYTLIGKVAAEEIPEEEVPAEEPIETGIENEEELPADEFNATEEENTETEQEETLPDLSGIEEEPTEEESEQEEEKKEESFAQPTGNTLNEVWQNKKITYNNFNEYYDNIVSGWDDCDASYDNMEAAFNAGYAGQDWYKFQRRIGHPTDLDYIETCFDAGVNLKNGKNTIEIEVDESLNESTELKTIEETHLLCQKIIEEAKKQFGSDFHNVYRDYCVTNPGFFSFRIDGSEDDHSKFNEIVNTVAKSNGISIYDPKYYTACDDGDGVWYGDHIFTVRGLDEDCTGKNSANKTIKDKSLNESTDEDLDRALKEHNEYIAYLRAEIEKVEKEIRSAKNDFIKEKLEASLETLKSDLDAAIPEAVKAQAAVDDLPNADELPDEASEGEVEAPEEEVKESLKEDVNSDLHKYKVSILSYADCDDEGKCDPCTVEVYAKDEIEAEEKAEEDPTFLDHCVACDRIYGDGACTGMAEVELVESLHESVEDEINAFIQSLKEECKKDKKLQESNRGSLEISDAEMDELFNSKEFKTPISDEEVSNYLEDGTYADKMDNDFSKVEDLHEQSFNENLSKYFTEVYSNAKDFKATKCELAEDKLIVEGIITFNSGKTKTTTFNFKLNNGLLEGYNKDICENKAFKLNFHIDDKKTLITESLQYNYRINNERVSGTTK